MPLLRSASVTELRASWLRAGDPAADAEQPATATTTRALSSQARTRPSILPQTSWRARRFPRRSRLLTYIEGVYVGSRYLSGSSTEVEQAALAAEGVGRTFVLRGPTGRSRARNIDRHPANGIGRLSLRVLDHGSPTS